MTEKEWLSATRPSHLLNLIRDRATDRKLRLVGCACTRRVAHLVKDERSLTALDFAEQMAERGTAGRKGRPAIAAAARQACDALWARKETEFDAADYLAYLSEANAHHAAWKIVSTDARVAAEACDLASLAAAYATCRTPPARTGYPADREKQIEIEQRQQVPLLRDIFGTPFRPVALKPAWLTFDVIALAKGIYDGRTFDLMPILADALQDAGCNNEIVLAHCRGEGPHVRGCWVVDLLLGKA